MPRSSARTAVLASAHERVLIHGERRRKAGGDGTARTLSCPIRTIRYRAPPLRPLVSAIAACLLTLANSGAADVRLPDIGSSAAAILSPQELREYGAGLLQELRAYDLVLDDPLASDYIASLGYRLVASSGQPDETFTFVIVRDNQINAFAAPGGLVAVNAGLITAVKTEDELAAVVAHEIAHVQQMHILRAFEDQKKMSIPIMLGMLGVMLAASGRDDDAAIAAMATGTSLIQQRQIDFTRSEEAEADRVGIQTLARAGFNPAAMADTFQTMQRVMRVNGVDVPEFLRTHPLDTNRIAEAKARAHQIGCPQRPPALPPTPRRPSRSGLDLSLPVASSADPATALPDEAAAQRASDAATVTTTPATPGGSLPGVKVETCFPAGSGNPYFDLMRERVRVLASARPTELRAYYANNLRDDPAFDTPANRYGYGLALVRARDPRAGVKELEALVDSDPHSTAFRLALAAAKDQAGDKAGALAIYDRLGSEFPGNRAITLLHADALLASADAANARKALELLRPMVERNPGDIGLQRGFGRANELAGDEIRAAEAYAEAAWLGGRPEDALNQLKALAKRQDLTYYQRSRIDARITQLTPAVLELRKRSSPSVTSPDSLRAPALRPRDLR